MNVYTDKNNMKIKILLAEDDPNLGALLKEYLTIKGYDVKLCENGDLAWRSYQQELFHLAIFDVMMPKMDGFELAKLIRENDSELPIIFLTARSAKDDRIEGLSIGGDDYMAKPFSMEELHLRIEAILRRSRFHSSNEKVLYQIGNYQFDVNQQSLSFPNQPSISLTTKETALLKMLGDYINDIMPRDLALKSIWKQDNYFTARSMDVYITKLRKYFAHDTNIQIKNIHGKGYKLMVVPEDN